MDSYNAISYALGDTKWKTPDHTHTLTASGGGTTGTLHKDELVLNKKDTDEILKISKGIGKMSKTPSKQKYEDALEIVKQYEDRQKDLAKLNKDLGHVLQQFNKFKFNINEDKKEITFTGVTFDGQLKLTKSVACSGDKFEHIIGKLIAAKKAVGEDIEYIEKFIEREYPYISEISSGGWLGTTTTTRDPYIYVNNNTDNF